MKTIPFLKRSWLIALVLFLGTGITILIVLHSNPTRAGGIDCSGDWGSSPDATVRETCAAQKASNSLTLAQEFATLTTQPYIQVYPNYTPQPMLPEPDDLKLVEQIPFNGQYGARPYWWAGVTSAWRDAAVPYTDYTLWDELYVLSRPGNGITYTLSSQAGGGVFTTTTNPTLETEIEGSVGGDPNESQYVKKWTSPLPVAKLIITNITNPAYTNTNPAVPYPGLQSIVYFTTASGQSGSFSMATEVWKFDSNSDGDAGIGPEDAQYGP
jgi:hypothetical protein